MYILIFRSQLLEFVFFITNGPLVSANHIFLCSMASRYFAMRIFHCVSVNRIHFTYLWLFSLPSKKLFEKNRYRLQESTVLIVIRKSRSPLNTRKKNRRREKEKHTLGLFVKLWLFCVRSIFPHLHFIKNEKDCQHTLVFVKVVVSIRQASVSKCFQIRFVSSNTDT